MPKSETSLPPADKEPPTGGAEPPAALALTPEPLLQGLAAIKAEDPDALRIWQVKGPRQGGGVLLGVLRAILYFAYPRGVW